MIDFTEQIEPLNSPDTTEIKMNESIPKEPLPTTPPPIKDLPNINSLSCGSIHIDSQGLWIGETFDKSAFKVSQAGESNVTSGNTTDVVTVLKAVYPIGAIYTTTIITNPATIFGFGTWIAFGTGRTLVGVDTTQTDFNTVVKTGGAVTLTIGVTNLPAHHHNVNPPNTTSGNNNANQIPVGRREMRAYDAGTAYTGVRPDGYSSDGTVYLTAPTHQHDVDIAAFDSADTGSGTALASMNPFVTVYFWRRTA
jgi:microcystin-dependent protein